MIRPTRRLVALLAAIALAGTIAVLQRSWASAVAIVPLVAMLAWSVAEVTLPMPAFAQRLVEATGPVLKDDEVAVRIRIPGTMAGHNLAIDEDLPDGWERVPGTTTAFLPVADTDGPGPTTQPARGMLEATYRLRPRRHGAWTLGEVRIVRVSALGLMSRTVAFPQATDVSVLTVNAQLRGVRVRPRPPSRSGVATRVARSGPGDEFYALREYLPGDELGRINWKATARMGRPITNEVLPDDPARYVLYVDARLPVSERGLRADALGRTLEAAGCLAEALIHARAHVGMVLLSMESRFLVPLGGQAQARRLRQMLMECRAGQQAPIATLLSGGLHLLPARSNAILFTADLYDRSLSEALLALRARHRHVDLFVPAFPEARGDAGLEPAWRGAAAVLNADQGALLSDLRPFADRIVQWLPEQPIQSAFAEAGLGGRAR